MCAKRYPRGGCVLTEAVYYGECSKRCKLSRCLETGTGVAG